MSCSEASRHRAPNGQVVLYSRLLFSAVLQLELAVLMVMTLHGPRLYHFGDGNRDTCARQRDVHKANCAMMLVLESSIHHLT